MTLFSHLWAKLAGLAVGMILFGWYLISIITDRATAEMLVFIPILQFYEPTMLDYVIGVGLAIAGGVAVYWILTRAVRHWLRKAAL